MQEEAGKRKDTKRHEKEKKRKEKTDSERNNRANRMIKKEVKDHRS